MDNVEVLNVSLIEPKLKHPTIFQHFDELAVGASFIIDNDHDPKPLYYELLGERGDVFSWEYVEGGPERWKVILTKKDPESDAGDIPAIDEKDIRKAELLKTKGIEFKCNDSKAPRKEMYPVVSASQDYRKWGLDFLADFIEHTHFRYLQDTMRVVEGLAVEVADHHGQDQPELKRLAQIITPFIVNLRSDISTMETILFPAIRHLIAMKKDDTILKADQTESIKRTAMTLQREHAVMQEDLDYMRRICKDYNLPEGACNSHAYLYQKLAEMETDLRYYFSLSDQVLLPGANALESEFLKVNQN